MSSAASVEVVHSPDEVAGLIDEGLTNVAWYVPDDVMKSPLGVGVPHEIHRVEGVGALHAMYLGFLAGPHQLGRLFDETSPHDRYSGVRIVAEEEQTGAAFWRDFAINYWRRPQLITPSTAENVVESQQHFPRLAQVVESLHKSYLERVRADSNVVDLAEYASKRTNE